MENIQRLASLSVWRGTGFAALAVATTMAAVAFDAVLAFRLGAFGTLLIGAALRLKSMLYHRKPVRETEVWVMLDVDDRPPPELAAGLIRNAMCAQLNTMATICATVAVALFATSWLWRLLS